MDAIPKDNLEHTSLIHKNILLSAWVQAAGMTLGPLFALGLGWLGWRRFRNRRRNKPDAASSS